MEQLNKLLEPYSLQCSEKQLQQFQTFYQLLIEWNEKMNLTAITEKEEVIAKHFFDSITPSFFLPFTNQAMIDIGAGAGFPSIPLKICFPDLKLTLLDSLNKRISFLQTVSNELGFKHMEFIHGRAEDYGQNKDHREKYDYAIARAVAKLNILSEFALPFVKIDGKMIALKGDPTNTEIEIVESKKAIEQLGGKLNQTKTLNLPNNYGSRIIVVLNKKSKTPNQYPRKAGTPSKKPLV